MKIALAQINPTVGDIPANSAKIKQYIARGRDAGAELVIFSELSLIGYPPKDLLLKHRFIDDNLTALDDIACYCSDCAALVGFACRHTGPAGRNLHNAAALLSQGRVSATYYKQLLPTYDVFDETRYFEPAQSQQVVTFAGRRLGLTICEDIWQGPQGSARPLYEDNPLAQLAAAGVDIVINMSASPFEMGKHPFRRELFAAQCRRYNLPLLYVNQVGGNDDLIFDGCSCGFDSRGRLFAQAQDFQEDLLLVDLENLSASRLEEIRTDIAAVHSALTLGLKDYVEKCRFQSVVLGLSGGIDSAVTAALAVSALGPQRVLGVTLPSRYNAPAGIDDARRLADNLGIRLVTIPIEKPFTAFLELLQSHFGALPPDVTEENIQARIRAVILMALSNKFNHLLLTTGNKSELAVGYCTIYGDMAGGLAVISDVPKTMIYQLARYINRDQELIPSSSINKPPTAELRENQCDQDSLPPYDVLDDILHRYVEQEQSQTEIIAAGFDPRIVSQVINLVDRNEYKRKQAAPGLKVTSRAFGVGRRMPIAQNYHPR